MQVKQIMNRDVVTVSPEQTLAQAARLLRDADCGAIPVLNNRNQVAGIVTDRDVALGALQANKPLGEITVEQAMTRNVQTAPPGAELSDAQALMREQNVRRLPIVDEEGRLLGILSLDDLARDAVLEGDVEMRQQVLETLAAVSQPYVRSGS